MSQSVLGKHLGGISHQAVTKIEAGRTRLSPDRLARIAELFDRPLTCFQPPEWVDFEASDIYRHIKPEYRGFAKSLLREVARL